MRERLHWTPLSTPTPTGPVFEVANPVPFADPRDYTILPNDWPYGLGEGIQHLIVWSKVRLDTQTAAAAAAARAGDMTPAARRLVEAFVRRVFVARVEGLPPLPAGAGDRVMWFRNWSALQSVPGLEHVHVLVRDVPDEIVQEWTDGERVRQW